MQLKHEIGRILSPEEIEKGLEADREARDAAWQRVCDRADEISIIDFHTHIFPEKIAKRALEQLSYDSGSKPFTGGTGKELQASMEKAGIGLSIVLPVITNPAKVAHINAGAARQNCTVDETGLLSFAGIHPESEDYRGLLKMAKKLGFQGIKLHPDYYGVRFNDIRIKRIVDFASELDLIIVTHAGTDIGLYPPICCTVDDVAEVVRDVRPGKLVAAHMGGWNNWDEVAEKLAGREVYVDTAFSIGEIEWNTPESAKYGFHQLSDEAFVQLVYALGTDRVLFATDSPWAEQMDYVNRMAAMPFTDRERKMIFSGNAKRLLGIPAE